MIVVEEEESRKQNVVVVVGKQQWKYNEAFFLFFQKENKCTHCFLITRKYNLFSSMLRVKIQKPKIMSKNLALGTHISK